MWAQEGTEGQPQDCLLGLAGPAFYTRPAPGHPHSPPFPTPSGIMDQPSLPPHVGFPSGPAGACPACAAPDCQLVYSVARIPIHSCVLLADQAQARGFPQGDLEWAVCRRCGFLFNRAFDASRIDYGEDYEETQGYSGTFRAFLADTIARLTDDHDLQGQTVVEIGPGRGDFLEALCRAAGARGVGIDPSRTAGRVDRSAGLGLEFLFEPYGPQHHSIEAAAVVCRHTLEHLPRVAELVELVRAHLGSHPERCAFFELPDTERILREGAFWDVYYEHCSYFSRASLRYLFESQGFAVDRLELVYGGQYLHLDAHPSSMQTHPQPDPASILEAVGQFQERCEASLKRWHAWLQASQPGSVALWGSGSKATGFLTTLGSWDRIQCVVDINPDKAGKFVAGSGHPIIQPSELPGRPIERVLIMNPIYRTEITRALADLGLHPEIEALGE